MENPTSVTSYRSEAHEGQLDWLKALRWCPRQLLDLINSKACRGESLSYPLSPTIPRPIPRSHYVQRCPQYTTMRKSCPAIVGNCISFPMCSWTVWRSTGLLSIHSHLFRPSLVPLTNVGGWVGKRKGISWSRLR